MTYTMLCSDLDGTLLGLKNRPTPYCCNTFKKYNKQIKMVLVSARMPSGMYYIQEALGIENEPLVCYNGALVLDRQKVISSTYITIELIEKVWAICENYGVAIGLYSHDEWFAPNRSERITKEEFNTQTKVAFEPTTVTISRWKKAEKGAHKLMLMGTKETADKAIKQLENTLGNVLGIYRSNDTLIEISPGSVDKCSAIKSLLDGLSSLKHIMAFGDNYNDMSMLQEAGLGIAVGNARKAVKEVADHVVAPFNEDGVAHFLEDFFNK